ncbi:phosphatase PAP2 family protein [Pseudoduganella chitinolytica]|uniref:Phosphatase PAP2 family protein n=1 Tax=Pseudoduganella chitinolytica TaxID=34070 RepID=A0ABY8BEM0_9BURK|nr:phosphatase PAP2 family protein [Pseudoduganella chitinolytica]WEF34151.1 phosphatase PAP2 family protein [Pseudoduganella chitinolytica]
MTSWWNALSALGGIEVTGPLGIAIAVWLLAGRSWRLSLAWCVFYGAGMTLVVLTKLAYMGWGIGIPELKFAGLSGHAMRACAVFPVAFYLALRHRGERPSRVALAAGVALAALVSISRVPVLAHSWSEVLLGGAVGFAVAAGFIWQARSEHPTVVGRLLLALCIPPLLVMPTREPVHTERMLKKLAVALSGRDTAVERAWRLGPEHADQRRLPAAPQRHPDARQQPDRLPGSHVRLAI